jgi:hypothetical protein
MSNKHTKQQTTGYNSSEYLNLYSRVLWKASETVTAEVFFSLQSNLPTVQGVSKREN